MRADLTSVQDAEARENSRKRTRRTILRIPPKVNIFKPVKFRWLNPFLNLSGDIAPGAGSLISYVFTPRFVSTGIFQGPNKSKTYGRR